MRNRFPFKSNEIRTNSNLTIFPPLSATPPCPPTMHAGIRDDRKGRPYAINRRCPDTPGGVSLQNSLLAFSQLQEHGAAVTVGRSACGRPHYERWDQGRPQGSPLRDKSAWLGTAFPPAGQNKKPPRFGGGFCSLSKNLRSCPPHL